MKTECCYNHDNVCLSSIIALQVVLMKTCGVSGVKIWRCDYSYSRFSAIVEIMRS